MAKFIEKILENSQLLENEGTKLQGNILRPHGRDHVTLLFFTFHSDTPTPELLKFLNSLAREGESKSHKLSITSAARQKELASVYRKTGKSQLFLSISFTARGLAWIVPVLPGKVKEKVSWSRIMEELEQGEDLMNMEDEDRRDEPHMLILLADDSPDLLTNREKYFIQAIRERCGGEDGLSIQVEHGRIYRNRLGQSVEHFGYADGISQPWFFKEQVDVLQPRDKWDPVAFAKKHFLVKEGKFWGSYLVYRKIAQDIEGFHSVERKEGEAAAADIVGRFKDGTPVVHHQNGRSFKMAKSKAELASKELYNFNFEGIPMNGKGCPHIQKMNRRKNNSSEEIMILRRGIPYGKRVLKVNGEFDMQARSRLEANLDELKQEKEKIVKDENEKQLDDLERQIKNIQMQLDELEDKEVGMLFMSYQSTMKKFQDLVITENTSEIGKDRLLGNAYDGPFVKLMHGYNLYTPSIPFFENLEPSSTLIIEETTEKDEM